MTTTQEKHWSDELRAVPQRVRAAYALLEDRWDGAPDALASTCYAGYLSTEDAFTLKNAGYSADDRYMALALVMRLGSIAGA